MFLLVISSIIGLFVNTMTADDTYSLNNSENLQQPIQMQLSKKRKFFASFLKPTSNFQHFAKKDDRHS